MIFSNVSLDLQLIETMQFLTDSVFDYLIETCANSNRTDPRFVFVRKFEID